MARYIDAEKELSEMKFAWYPQDMDTTNAVGMYERFLKNAPSEDVAPVIHAHWCVTDAYPHNVYCSKCLIIFAQTHWPVWKDKSLPRTYCPSCGAIMDGKKEG